MSEVYVQNVDSLSYECIPFESLKGLTLSEIVCTNYKDEITNVIQDIDSIFFKTTEGKYLRMYHNYQCCEQVYVESIVGDLADLIGTQILLAEESTVENPSTEEILKKATFYKLGTIKGYVDIRWNGTSNGYYSVDVSLVELGELPNRGV